MVLTKGRIALAVVFVVGVAAIVIQKMWESRRPGRIVVFAPPDRDVELTVDGERLALKAGGFARRELAHGGHHVAVKDGPARDLQIRDGFDLLAVPTLPTQCFAEIDVTLSHYGQARSRPKVTRVFRRDRPFQLPKTFALSEAELPKQTTERVNRDGKIVGMQLVFMFQTVPCTEDQTYWDGSL